MHEAEPACEYDRMNDERGHESTFSLDAMLAVLPLAALVVDTSGRIQAHNSRAAAWVGDGSMAGADVIESLFAEPTQGAAGEVHRQVLGGQAWEGDLPVLRSSGDAQVSHVSWTLVRDAKRVDGSLLVLEDLASSHRQSHRQSQRLAERLTSLARASTELLQAKDLDEVTDIVTGHLADAAGATVATLSVLEEGDRLRLIGMRGGREGAIDRWRTYSTIGTPAGDAVTSGTPLILTGRAEIHSRYPDLETASRSLPSWSLPRQRRRGSL
jgi:hypothetical protein